jgi:hypothetical protein
VRSEVDTAADGMPSSSGSRREDDAPSSSSLFEEDAEGTFHADSLLEDEDTQSIPAHNLHRSKLGLPVFDEILGCEAHEMLDEQQESRAGMAPGCLLEVAGTPGCGKTILLIQIAVLERLNSILNARESAKGKAKMKEEEEEEELTWMEWGDASQKVMLIGESGYLALEMSDTAETFHLNKTPKEGWAWTGLWMWQRSKLIAWAQS